jgi:hypothetical protein
VIKSLLVGVAWTSYVFGLLGPGQTAGIYIHGYDANAFLTFDLGVYQVSSLPSAFHASVALDVETVDLHVDQTKAYNITVTNHSTGNSVPKPYVSLLAFQETVSG